MRGGYASGFAVVGFWTAFMLVSRLGLAGASPVTAYDMLALRLATSAVVLTPFCGDIGRRVWTSWRLWVLALVGGVAYGLMVYAGFRLAPATHGALLFPGMLPFETAVLGWWLLGRRPSPIQWGGYTVIAGGLALMVPILLRGGQMGESLSGDVLLLGASMSWAVYGVLAKRWNFGPWLLTRFLGLAPALVYLPVYALFLPKNMSAAEPFWLASQGIYHGVVTTLVVMWLYLRAQDRLGPERLGALMALVPVFSGGLAVFILGEDMSPILALSLVLVSLGAWLAARSRTFVTITREALIPRGDH